MTSHISFWFFVFLCSLSLFLLHLTLLTPLTPLPGDDVSVFYDPMIAKLVVWDVDRHAALRALTYALTKYKVVGPENNVAFLLDLARHPAFVKGEVETGFIAKYKNDLLPAVPAPASPNAVAQAALWVLLKERAADAAMAASSSGMFCWRHFWSSMAPCLFLPLSFDVYSLSRSFILYSPMSVSSFRCASILSLFNVVPSLDPSSPRWSTAGFRMNLGLKRVLQFKAGDDGKTMRSVTVSYNGDGSFDLLVQGADKKAPAVSFPGVRGSLVGADQADIEFEINKELTRGTVVPEGDSLYVFAGVRLFFFVVGLTSF